MEITIPKDKLIAEAFEPMVDGMTDKLVKTLIGKPVLINFDPNQKVGEVIDAWLDDGIRYKFTLDKKLGEGKHKISVNNPSTDLHILPIN